MPSNSESNNELISFAHNLADASAAVIAPFFRQSLQVDHKGTNAQFDPVTEADRAGEAVIRARIQATYPDHSILGEEHGAQIGTSEYRWVIDPIDGTRGFILGLPTWGTLIGLEHNGKPLIGMMNQPYTQDRFWSDGQASYFRSADGNSRTIKTRTTITRLADAQLASTHPDLFATKADAAAFAAVRAGVRACRFGTDCFGYALLAAGLIDAVMEAGLQPYDVAALIPIIENAGGVITTWEGNSARNGGRIIAAANQELHAELMTLISTTAR